MYTRISYTLDISIKDGNINVKFEISYQVEGGTVPATSAEYMEIKQKKNSLQQTYVTVSNKSMQNLMSSLKSAMSSDISDDKDW